MKKKAMGGQGAVEYLFNYMWVILIVMVLGVTIWRLGILSPQTPTTFTGFSKIRPQTTGISMRTDGKFTGTFVNAVGMPISSVNVESIQNLIDKIACTNLGVSSTTVAKGQHFEITATGCVVGEHQINDIWELEIKLSYVISMGGGVEVNSSDYGIIKGPYQ